MAFINILPKSVAELIAAGEVVERPASVIKELVENSVDAGAKNIQVEIKSGGIKYIRVTDDGCGIARDEVRTAFVSHATSKIRTSEDLNSIFTLGFRGEALPSIAAVSKLSLLTRTENEETGTRYETEGGEEVSFGEAGCPTGTTFIVRDLFYNTPARMKFLKRDVTEGTYAGDTVIRLALAHPDIRFTFVRDSKTVLTTAGEGDMYAAVYSVFGKETAQALLPVYYAYGGITVEGYISRPLSNRTNRNMQFFFVNGRPVKIPAAVPALDEAYKNRIMVGRFPMCFLRIGIPTDKIDVNVHPAKTEIRFSNERAIFEAVYYASVSALNKGDVQRPSMALPQKKDVLQRSVPTGEQMRFPQSVSGTAAPVNQVPEELKGALLRDPSSENVSVQPVKKEEEKETEKAEPINKGFTPSREPSVPVRKINIDIHCDPEPEKEPAVSSPAASDRPFSSAFAEKKEKERAFVPHEETPAAPAAPDPIPEAEEDFRIVGEVFKTYILVERGNKMLIIDKHAAHERMIFDSLKKNSKAAGSQILMFPVSVVLSGREYAAVTENAEVFEKAGWVVEDFGGGTVLVRECPVELQTEDISAVMTEIAGKLEKGCLRPVPEKLDWLYHSTACRAAIKGGDEMKPGETEIFVRALLKDDSIRYCPHGRPVLYELPKSEIEKQFGRLG